MKQQNKIGIDDERISNKELNIQRSKDYKISYEISINNFINKKLKSEIKKIDEIKDLGIKDDISVRGNIPIKEKKEKK